MSLHNREEKYFSILSTGSRTIKELSEILFVSEPTVRRDVIVMKEKNLITCHRGVVQLKSKYADQRVPLFLRNLEFNEEKEVIALKAIKHIKDGDVLMLDSSTSAYHLLPHLISFKHIMVITNGAKIALEAAALGIKTICTGGEMSLESFSYIGSDAEKMLSQYNADIAFFSCRGLSYDNVATDNSIWENSIRKIMIKNSKRQYLLCDKSKFGNVLLNKLCDEKDITQIITN